MVPSTERNEAPHSCFGSVKRKGKAGMTVAVRLQVHWVQDRKEGCLRVTCHSSLLSHREAAVLWGSCP